ncbi:MAG: hypothetical protein LBC80_06740 [Treponema sp.]|jgi:hypothetical protein|nr:hypothetical protein [Treponema sp.]
MADELNKITSDLDYIIESFRPVLNKLQENHDSPVFLSSFTNFANLKNIGNWAISLLKANLNNEKAIHMFKYNEKYEIFHFYIILDEVLFNNTNEMKIIKKTIIAHEFIHFLAFFYAIFSSSGKKSRQKSIERLSKISADGESINKKTLNLLEFLNKSESFVDFYSYKQVNDSHFRTGIENMPIDYSELFKNFLFPRQIFDEYFILEKRKMFFNLLREHEQEKAFKIFSDISDIITEKEFLSKSFVYDQAIDIIMKFYSNEYVKG